METGDYVLAENPETGEQEYKRVANTYIHKKDVIVHVRVGDEEIETTREHPFYVEGVGFVQAGSLKPGDKVRLADGRNLEACEIEVEYLSEPVYVYNFEVEDYHTYFVSELGVLVHNDCGPGTGNNGGSTPKVHGNSKLSTKPQHGYEIYNTETGDVVKTGISGQKLNLNGTSPRANSQVNKLNRSAGKQLYDSRIVARDMPNRQSALEWERENALRLWYEGNSMSLHKRPRPWEE